MTTADAPAAGPAAGQSGIADPAPAKTGTAEPAPAGPVPAKTGTAEPAPADTGRTARGLVEWTFLLALALVAALILRTFLIGAFYIPSDSMNPNLTDGDRVLVNKLAYLVSDPVRGDVVVFRPPAGTVGIETQELIKRVVAVGGDTVQGRLGAVFVNGSPQPEDYLAPDTRTTDFGPVDVPDAHVFVMGDRRSNSRDSRWFGAVSFDDIVGRAFVKYWPPANLGGL
ncbi:MAG TPA: signal peptidase I [Acidimicrobiaceae bacterium]|nr:signal peptidase I [Acidimicrobiaceae bacterium]HCB37938.1 signal peptidase I [Acidimicrobiaceae bacterium]